MEDKMLLKISNDVSAIKEAIKGMSRDMRDIKLELNEIRNRVQYNENKINSLEGKLKGQKYITMTVSTIVGVISWIAGLIIGKFM